MEWIWVIVALLLAFMAWSQWYRRRELRARYDSDPFMHDVLSGRVRQGMTAQHVIDAWGPPSAIDEKVLKSKVVHTYKYAKTGTRSFRQRVQIENGKVVGWTSR